jgi:hypothetical protein
MPLIRYRVGDVGRLLTEDCGCGRMSTRIEVMGRVSETLSTPNGPLTSSEVADALFSDPGVSNFRVEEIAPDRFDITIVGPLDGATARPEDVRDVFAELHGGVRNVRCRTAAYVLPEPNGKYRLVHPASRPHSPFGHDSSLLLAS